MERLPAKTNVTFDDIAALLATPPAIKTAALPPQRVLNEVGRLVPPMPNTVNIPPAVTPHPPRLDSGASDDRKVLALVFAHVGACKSRFGKARFYARTMPPPDVQAVLLEAAAELVALGIAPAAWAAFSCDVWAGLEGDKKRSPPPLKWVFSANRVRERSGWFAKDSATYGGGRIVYSQGHMPAWRAWQAMWLAFRRAEPTITQAEIKALVEQHFPGGWRRTFDQIRRESAEQSASLRSLADKGEWLW